MAKKNTVVDGIKAAYQVVESAIKDTLVPGTASKRAKPSRSAKKPRKKAARKPK